MLKHARCFDSWQTCASLRSTWAGARRASPPQQPSNKRLHPQLSSAGLYNTLSVGTDLYLCFSAPASLFLGKLTPWSGVGREKNEALVSKHEQTPACQRCPGQVSSALATVNSHTPNLPPSTTTTAHIHTHTHRPICVHLLNKGSDLFVWEHNVTARKRSED